MAYGIASNAANDGGDSNFDVRVFLGVRGTVVNFLILAIPFFDKQTDETMFDVVFSLLERVLGTYGSEIYSLSQLTVKKYMTGQTEELLYALRRSLFLGSILSGVQPIKCV